MLDASELKLIATYIRNEDLAIERAARLEMESAARERDRRNRAPFLDRRTSRRGFWRALLGKGDA